MPDPHGSPQRPPAFDTSVPHSARVMNYWLGGKDWYPADRAMGDQILESFPEIVAVMRADRVFLERAVTFLVRDAGVRQFLDLGTGLPTANNTHEVAQAIAPESRIVYVDNDPLVLTHARALLTSAPQGATEYVDADVRDTDRILTEAAATLDFSKPIAVSLLGITTHLEDDEAYGVVRRYVDALPVGSYLALCDCTDTSDAIVRAASRWNESASPPVRLRTIEGITSFFDGLEVQPPGVVPALRWRPGHTDIGGVKDVDLYGGIGRKV
nr:SAM-dependent methyltransferase [Spiractinospora alimapuensis]